MLPAHLSIPDFDEWGMRAFTTSRAAGTFGGEAVEPAAEVLGRWNELVEAAATLGARRFASGVQVHGAAIAEHRARPAGWLRTVEVDGHAWASGGVGAAVTVADCVPVFIAHESGAGAILHSGWKGTVGGITERTIEWFGRRGFGAGRLRIHLGPAICGACYEVSPEVYALVTGATVAQPTPVDLRAAIADRARTLGVRDISVSEWCTRCSNDRLFSHRAGDLGRQLGVLIAPDSRNS